MKLVLTYQIPAIKILGIYTRHADKILLMNNALSGARTPPTTHQRDGRGWLENRKKRWEKSKKRMVFLSPSARLLLTHKNPLWPKERSLKPTGCDDPERLIGDHAEGSVSLI